jgi:alpha-1,3-rhamnosyl/mannosyltransferase
VVLDGRVIADDFPGIGRYVACLAEALARTGEVALTLLWRPSAVNTRFELTGRRWTLHAVDVAPFSLAEQTSLPALARRLEPDVWHAPFYVLPYRRLPCPTVVTFYDTIPLALPELWPFHQRALFSAAHRMALRASSRAIAVSASTRRDLVRRFGADPRTISVTPLAPAERFRPPPSAEVERVRRTYDLPARLVLSVGTNAPAKNLPRLTAAFHRLATADSALDYACVIAGTSAASRAGSVWESRTAAPVRFLGTVPEADLPALYASADLFVSASLYEGFGLPALEAMACGTPVAYGDAASLPEVVGDAGVPFDPTDVAAIARAIRATMSDAALRSTLRERGLRRARQFTWDDVARRTLDVYRAAIRDPRAEHVG